MFVDQTVKEIVRNNQEVKSMLNPYFSFKYVSVDVKKPCILNEGARELTPAECRLRKMSYAAPIMAMVHLRLNKDESVMKQEVRLGNIPVMLRSNRCVLNGRSLAEQVRLDEDYYDPGGYFIINGTEKVLMMVEQTAANRIIVTEGADGVLVAAVTSDTHERKTKAQVILRDKRLYLQQNMFGKTLLNLAVVYKAMGVASDQQIVQLVGGGPVFQEFLQLTLYDAAELGIFTQRQALAYLSTFLQPRVYKMKKSPIQETIDCLANYVLCHIQVAQRLEPPPRTLPKDPNADPKAPPQPP